MSKRKLVSFDRAMKKLLRSKANFEILVGFLSELLSNGSVNFASDYASAAAVFNSSS